MELRILKNAFLKGQFYFFSLFGCFQVTPGIIELFDSIKIASEEYLTLWIPQENGQSKTFEFLNIS